jgi:cobalt/nickel transport system permease protein
VALLLAHLPVMLVEGVVTALVVSFLARVRPEALDFAHVR